jgi:hypothetical protein
VKVLLQAINCAALYVQLGAALWDNPAIADLRRVET